ncbi:hypothetical protein [Petrachloros mirabilis]
MPQTIKPKIANMSHATSRSPSELMVVFGLNFFIARELCAI